MIIDAEDKRASTSSAHDGANAARKPLSPEDTVNLEGVEEALRSSWRMPRAVDVFPEEPEAMAPSEEVKLTSRGRRQRIAEILSIVRKYEAWHNLTPRRLRRMLEDLGPMFVKMGQILANRSEILPQEYCNELRRLRSNVEPVPFAVVNDCLVAEYGRPLGEIFSHIDRKPLGSASLAQVHRATLLTGEDVVVEELWQSFREETNFLMEARNLDEFHRLHEDDGAISCPRSYLAYCTEHIVVMDYVDGISIADPERLVEAGYDLEKVGSSIVDDYATQVLQDGFFHADPHAGNIIVRDGIVYFIDMGMVGRMSSHDRGIVKDMIYAVATGDVPKLKDSLMRFAVTRGDSAELDHSTFLSDLDFIIADFAGLDLKDLDIGEFLTSLISLARKNDVELPSVVTMFARGMVTLEGLLTEYMPDVNMIEIITEHIEHEKSSYRRAREAADELTHASYRALKGHLEMAEQLGLASRMLTRGQLKMNMQVLGSEQVLRHVGGIVDRLSMAIVIAGLFIGSSVVYYAKIEPVIFGIPVIGFLGYASALFLALGLGREIWRNSHGGK